MTFRSNLERVLVEHGFAVTAEIGPPKGADPQKILQKAERLRGVADAFNITDNQTAVVRLSSLAGSCLLLRLGIEPIVQMTCRDRNRLALQSDVLGASAIGVRNILCLTGDHQSFGNHPQARGVYDVDSVQLIQILKNMRDDGVFQSGDEITSGKPNIFIGAAVNPFAEPVELHLDRLEKKIRAGADFVQTQSVFHLDRFAEWIDMVRSRGLDTRIPVLAGVTPLKSLKMTERMKYHVPGAVVPDEVEARMQGASDVKKEGFDLALESIQVIKKMRGVRGVHITALFWEEIIPSLVREAGLSPRP
ncbi:MAG: methylenetetrahydrofolate reductase [Methanobacteriota archaeon]